MESYQAEHPGLQQEVELYASIVRSIDRRPPEEQKERPLNRQQRRSQQRQRRRQVILVRL
jgi:hypothetical protein